MLSCSDQLDHSSLERVTTSTNMAAAATAAVVMPLSRDTCTAPIQPCTPAPQPISEERRKDKSGFDFSGFKLALYALLLELASTEVSDLGPETGGVKGVPGTPEGLLEMPSLWECAFLKWEEAVRVLLGMSAEARLTGGGADPSVSPGLLSGTGVCSKLLYRLCELATGVPPLLEEAPAEPDLTVASEIAFIQSCRSLAVLVEAVSMAVEAHLCPWASSKMNLYFFNPVDSASCSTMAQVMFHVLHGARNCSAT
ncbi:MAG: hypothetical protein FRX49_08299 [Trebouxia sp. A1-2]|nr:MAG: hypothetical protein FRX49_08299 [Trebouxia sp. A1-2]